MQHLLSQKQDTPKGSSGSEVEDDQEMEEVCVEYVPDEISPEPTRKYNHNSMH